MPSYLYSRLASPLFGISHLLKNVVVHGAEDMLLEADSSVSSTMAVFSDWIGL
jgi:hypothetical protein